MKKAFTLAEVLITLGIIGVVAALTLPSVIQNQQKKSLEVATKKFYTTMSQAVRQYMADEGVDDLRNTALACTKNTLNDNEDCDQKSIDDFVTKYFKIVKKCEPDHVDECFYDGGYIGFDGREWELIDTMLSYYYSYVLSDGMSLAIGFYYHDVPIDIYIDVNGKKGPNKVGYDLWSMSLFYDGTLDESYVTPEYRKEGDSAQEIRDSRFEVCQEGTSYGGCFGHFLENGFKFDY